MSDRVLVTGASGPAGDACLHLALGPYDYKPSYFGQALIQLARGRIPALVPGGFDWVDVRDVVAGAMRAEEVAPPGARYLLGGHWHTIREVAELAPSFAGWRRWLPR